MLPDFLQRASSFTILPAMFCDWLSWWDVHSTTEHAAAMCPTECDGDMRNRYAVSVGYLVPHIIVWQ